MMNPQQFQNAVEASYTAGLRWAKHYGEDAQQVPFDDLPEGFEERWKALVKETFEVLGVKVEET